jgi:hypothetical protein
MLRRAHLDSSGSALISLAGMATLAQLRPRAGLAATWRLLPTSSRNCENGSLTYIPVKRCAP